MKTFVAALVSLVAMFAGVPAYASTQPPVDGQTVAFGIVVLIVFLACVGLLSALLRKVLPDAPPPPTTDTTRPTAPPPPTTQLRRRRNNDPHMPLIM